MGYVRTLAFLTPTLAFGAVGIFMLAATVQIAEYIYANDAPTNVVSIEYKIFYDFGAPTTNIGNVARIPDYFRERGNWILLWAGAGAILDTVLLVGLEMLHMTLRRKWTLPAAIIVALLSVLRSVLVLAFSMSDYAYADHTFDPSDKYTRQSDGSAYNDGRYNQTTSHYNFESWQCALTPHIADAGEKARAQDLCNEAAAARWLTIPVVLLSIVVLVLWILEWRRSTRETSVELWSRTTRSKRSSGMTDEEMLGKHPLGGYSSIRGSEEADQRGMVGVQYDHMVEGDEPVIVERMSDAHMLPPSPVARQKRGSLGGYSPLRRMSVVVGQAHF